MERTWMMLSSTCSLAVCGCVIGEFSQVVVLHYAALDVLMKSYWMVHFFTVLHYHFRGISGKFSGTVSFTVLH